MLIVLSSVAMLVTMYIMITKLEHQLLPSGCDQFSPSELSWFIFGALVKQGSSLAPSADVARSVTWELGKGLFFFSSVTLPNGL